MNLPNKLTIIRMVAVPIFLAALSINFAHRYLVALVIFCLASLTDYFDGKLARKGGLITNFGKFLDPLADKMLTTAALLAFIGINNRIYGAVWVAFITLFREFLVAGIRLSAVADGGKVIAANNWGKAKTVCQMVAIIFVLFSEWLLEGLKISQDIFKYFELSGTVLLWAGAVLTVISGTIYVIKNIKYIDIKS